MITAPLMLLPHNWAEEPVRRRLTWKTDLLVAWNGSEQRRRIRKVPLELLTYHITLLNAEEAGALQSLLWSEDMRVAVPRWEDGVMIASPITLGDTLLSVTADVGNRQLVGDAVLFWEGRNEEVVDVLSATGTTVTLAVGTTKAWPSGVLLVPVVHGRLTAPVEGETFGQLKGHATIAVEVESDVAGLTAGGASAPMVPGSMSISDEGFTNEFPVIARGDIKGLIVSVLDANGNIIPDPVISVSFTPGALDVYPQGMPGLFNVKNLKTSGGQTTETVVFTAGGVTTSFDIVLA